MKPERHQPSPPVTPTTDPVQAMRDEDERLRAELTYLKIACIDPVEEVNCAESAHLLTRIRQHNKVADLSLIASLARSTFYSHQQLLIRRAASQSDLKAEIRTVSDHHKDRYGYWRITAELRRSADNCFDKAVIESFFGILKAEYLYLAVPSSIEVFEAGVNDYIRYYNDERIKLRLRGLSPVEYRLRNTACSAAPYRPTSGASSIPARFISKATAGSAVSCRIFSGTLYVAESRRCSEPSRAQRPENLAQKHEQK